MLRAGDWSALTVLLTKAEVLLVHSAFISCSTWGMPAGYSFGSAPSPGRKKSTKAARDPRAAPLALALPTRFFAFSEVPRTVARESNNCSDVIGLIVIEA